MKLIRMIKRFFGYLWGGIKRNKLKIVNGLIIVLTILGVGLVEIFKPLILDITPIRHRIMETKLENIKIGYSKKYVETLLGTAHRNHDIYWTNSEGGKYKISRVDYIEEDYLYTLFYKEDESILGYALISRDRNFNPKLPFDDSLPLLKHKQDDYLDMASGEVRFTTYSASGTRGDVSDYEMDFGYGHLFTNNLIVGYGVSELGYRKNRDALYDYISNYIRKAPIIKQNNDSAMYSLVGDNIYTYDDLRNDENLQGIKADPESKYRKKLYPNAIFVIDGRFSSGNEGVLYGTDVAFEFIVDQLEFGLLYYRLDFYR
ncbi:ETEC_3214 domain-containing protein [Paenibacillus sp. FSL H3-0310]|uniref:ETEC_3214 domain-containing protein n=1 Tax=Paenibacillus sp. FSL H3-0310 TaxID=2921429 RepID=UPI0030F8F547